MQEVQQKRFKFPVASLKFSKKFVKFPPSGLSFQRFTCNTHTHTYKFYILMCLYLCLCVYVSIFFRSSTTADKQQSMCFYWIVCCVLKVCVLFRGADKKLFTYWFVWPWLRDIAPNIRVSSLKRFTIGISVHAKYTRFKWDLRVNHKQ